MCLVETSKALLELEAPGDGILRHLYAQGDEVELGGRVAVVAESEEELAAVEESARREVRAGGCRGPANATRRAVELAEEHGIDLASIEKDGFITAEDVERLVVARAAEVAADAPGLFAGVSARRRQPARRARAAGDRGAPRRELPRVAAVGSGRVPRALLGRALRRLPACRRIDRGRRAARRADDRRCSADRDRGRGRHRRRRHRAVRRGVCRRRS